MVSYQIWHLEIKQKISDTKQSKWKNIDIDQSICISPLVPAMKFEFWLHSIPQSSNSMSFNCNKNTNNELIGVHFLSMSFVYKIYIFQHESYGQENKGNSPGNYWCKRLESAQLVEKGFVSKGNGIQNFLMKLWGMFWIWMKLLTIIIKNVQM